VSSLLEERYRRVLRLLPADFRRDWADDMVATFLDRAYRSMPGDPESDEISSPRWSELVSIARLALRLRLGGPGSRPGEVVRRIALTGLLAHVVFALAGVVLSIWYVERMPLPDGSGFTTWWQAMWSMTHLLWLPAYLAILFGHRRAAAITAVAAFVPGAVSSIVQLRGDQWAHAPYQIEWLIFGVLPVLALAGFHGEVPVARPWVVAVPVGVVLVSAAGLLAPQRATGTALWALGIIVAGLVTIVAGVRQGRTMPPAWPLTLALLAAAVLGLQAASGRLDPFALGAAAIGILLAVLAARARRRTAGRLPSSREQRT
jgi:hypothetical protein